MCICVCVFSVSFSWYIWFCGSVLVAFSSRMLFHSNLTLCISMDSCIHIDTISIGLPIAYFKGSQMTQIEFLKL